MEQTDEKILKIKKYNAKLFPFYKMFSWDLLFYYSINFLFLTQVKGFSASNILLLDASYTVFKIIFQIPCINIAERLGNRKSILIGNVLIAMSILIVILSQKMSHVMISYALMGFGFILKDLCDSIFLRDCITAKEHQGTAFTNLDGKGASYWYIFDAITSISCGFLFVFNKYLPMCLCLTMTIISCIFAFKFKAFENTKKDRFTKTSNHKTYLKDLQVAFKNLLKSNRLKALFLFSGLFIGLFAIRSTFASSLFTDIGIKEEYFGIIFAFTSILSACFRLRRYNGNSISSFFNRNILLLFSSDLSTFLI